MDITDQDKLHVNHFWELKGLKQTRIQSNNNHFTK